MFKSIIWQIKLALSRKVLHYVFLVMLTLSCLAPVIYLLDNLGNTTATNYDSLFSNLIYYDFSKSGSTAFPILFPLIVFIPFASIYSINVKLHNSSLQIIRFGRKKYYVSQCIANFIIGFTSIFIPLFLNSIISYIFLGKSKCFIISYDKFGLYNWFISFYYYPDSFTNYPYPIPYISFLLQNQLVYTILFILLSSLFWGLCTVFMYACTFFIKRFYIKAVIPLELIMLFGLTSTNSYLTKVDSFETRQYLNKDLFSYVSINEYPGKNYWLFSIICCVMIVFSFLSIYKKIREDQFD